VGCESFEPGSSMKLRAPAEAGRVGALRATVVVAPTPAAAATAAPPPAPLHLESISISTRALDVVADSCSCVPAAPDCLVSSPMLISARLRRPRPTASPRARSAELSLVDTTAAAVGRRASRRGCRRRR
jgi:hypothetical protein